MKNNDQDNNQPNAPSDLADKITQSDIQEYVEGKPKNMSELDVLKYLEDKLKMSIPDIQESLKDHPQTLLLELENKIEYPPNKIAILDCIYSQALSSELHNYYTEQKEIEHRGRRWNHDDILDDLDLYPAA